jgi:hypothetical protein
MRTYARIAPCSSLSLNNHVHTMAGVIDPDYFGELKVLIHNFGNQPQRIDPRQKIAQLIFEQAYIPDIDIIDKLDQTTHGHNGFGSTNTDVPNLLPNTPPVVPCAPILDPLVPTQPAIAPPPVSPPTKIMPPPIDERQWQVRLGAKLDPSGHSDLLRDQRSAQHWAHYFCSVSQILNKT